MSMQKTSLSVIVFVIIMIDPLFVDSELQGRHSKSNDLFTYKKEMICSLQSQLHIANSEQ